MKKVFLILALAVGLGSQAQTGTYLKTGTSIVSKSLSERAEFGTSISKTKVGVLVETKSNPNRRNWETGVALTQGIPLAPTIDLLVGGEGRVDVTRKVNNTITLEPYAGFGFTILPKVQFQATYGQAFAERTEYSLESSKSNVNLGLQFNL